MSWLLKDTDRAKQSLLFTFGFPPGSDQTEVTVTRKRKTISPDSLNEPKFETKRTIVT